MLLCVSFPTTERPIEAAYRRKYRPMDGRNFVRAYVQNVASTLCAYSIVGRHCCRVCDATVTMVDWLSNDGRTICAHSRVRKSLIITNAVTSALLLSRYRVLLPTSIHMFYLVFISSCRKENSYHSTARKVSVMLLLLLLPNLHSFQGTAGNELCVRRGAEQ